MRTIACVVMFASGRLSLAAPPVAPASPQAGKAAPAFTLPDLRGKSHSLAEYQGRNVALFFYCGCEPCHACARAWTDVQRSGELETPQAASNNPPKTETTGEKQKTDRAERVSLPPLSLVVYTGAAADASRFAAETGLDANQTIVLTDDGDRIANLYQALACPRVFVLDRKGILRYTNPAPTETAKALSAAALVSRALTELRHCDPLPTSKALPRQHMRKGSSHAG